MASIFVKRMRGAVAFVGLGVKATPNELDTATPQITSGAGAPSAALADGSLYLRTDAASADDSLYQRIGAAWVALDGAP